MAQNEQNTENDSRDDVRDTRVADEEHARLVAVTDSPADEIRVRLTAQTSFDHVFDKGERRGVSSVF